MPLLLATLTLLTVCSQGQTAVDRLHGDGEDRLPAEGLLAVPGALSARGIVVHALLLAEASRAFTGGLRRGNALRELLDLDLGLELDLGPLLGATGRLQVGYQWIRGDNATSDLVGDLQGFSNLDAEPRSQLARFYWEGVVPDGDAQLILRAGKFDANAVFAMPVAGGRFLSSSAGFSPTILGLPTYPDPAFGVTVGRLAAEGSGVRVFDGSGARGKKTGTLGPEPWLRSPSALFAIGEAVRDADPCRVVLGAWWLETELARFDGGSESRAVGWYSVFERRVRGTRRDEHGTVDLFAQLGTAPAAVSPVRRHLAAGALWRGPLAGREADRLGLYLSHARAGNDTDLTASGELEVELFYSFPLTPWLRLEPDLQFVRDPGATSADDAWIGTLRLSAAL